MSAFPRTALPHIVTLGHMPPQQRRVSHLTGPVRLARRPTRSAYCACREHRHETSRHAASHPPNDTPAQADVRSGPAGLARG